MERKTERWTKAAIFITGALILFYTLSIADIRLSMGPTSEQGGRALVNEEKKQTGGELVNRGPSHQARNSGKTDRLEETRITNSLRLRHLERACKEVTEYSLPNTQLNINMSPFLLHFKR